MKIIDISLTLNSDTLIYPGNVGFSVEAHHTMQTHATHLSKIIMGSHTGTHVDAPSHAIINGKSLDQIPLETFIGRARVLDLTLAENCIKTEDLKKKKIRKGERILAKTRNSLAGFKNFNDKYIYLDGSAADYLAELGIKLFAIDYLSVKQRGSNDYRPHTSLLENNIPIIEGVDLGKVEEGQYELIALPLKIQGIEGAPLRAILIER